MIVKVLGTGCLKCNALEQKVNYLAQKHNIAIQMEKVTDLDDITSYGVMMTPSLIINGDVKSSGKIPSDDQIVKWLQGD